MSQAESPATAPTIDRVSFLIGYLIARTDGAAEILDLVDQAEALIEGEVDVEVLLLGGADEPARRQLPAPQEDGPPHPAPCAESSAAANGSGASKRARIVELYRTGHRPTDIAAALGISPKHVSVDLSKARKRGDLPPANSPGDMKIKTLNPAPLARDVTASLMGDPGPGRSAAGEPGEE